MLVCLVLVLKESRKCVISYRCAGRWSFPPKIEGLYQEVSKMQRNLILLYKVDSWLFGIWKLCFLPAEHLWAVTQFQLWFSFTKKLLGNAGKVSPLYRNGVYSSSYIFLNYTMVLNSSWDFSGSDSYWFCLILLSLQNSSSFLKIPCFVISITLDLWILFSSQSFRTLFYVIVWDLLLSLLYLS